MGVNVVNYGGKTLVDMRNATATAETVLAGYTAYGADGDLVVGTMTPTLPKTASIRLSKDRWIDNQQSVDVDFVTADAMVIAGGEPGSQEYFDCEVWCSGQDDGRLIFSCTYEPMEDVFANIGMLMTGELVISYARGSVIHLTDASYRKLHGLTIYGKTTQNGTPSPTAPVPMVSHGDSGSLIVKIGTSESDTNPQTLTVSTPNGLPGVRVSDGGNYTDENGWQWNCDEVDFGRGVYVKRIAKLELNGTEGIKWLIYGGTNLYHLDLMNDGKKYGMKPIYGLCNRVPKISNGTLSVSIVARAAVDKGLEFKNVVNTFGLSECTSDAFNAYLAENPIVFIYELETPIETPLNSQELDQYAALRTYSPNTTIYTNTEADMMVRYVKE